jgi:hypothetical protein
MPFSHSARQAEPLLPLAVFLLVPLLLAAGVRRHTVQSAPVAKSAIAPAIAPALAAPVLPSAGGTRGR